MRLIIMVFCTSLFAASPVPVLLEHPDLPDIKSSVLSGALAFKQRCVSCHSLRLAGYDSVLRKQGLTVDIMPVHEPSAWQGHPPPDLSLVARTRGADWIYTYLHSFYDDPSNPKGYNNLLMPNASMPAILSDLQGKLVRVDTALEIDGIPHPSHWFSYLRQEKAGSMTPEQYSLYVLDIVNFLDYVAEPYRSKREALGWKVILFLLCFSLVARLLYKSYWQDLK